MTGRMRIAILDDYQNVATPLAATMRTSRLSSRVAPATPSASSTLRRCPAHGYQPKPAA
jgi:hypothetical protein